MNTIATRGIIEGFYGPPWTFEARRRAIRFLAERGGTTYVYAPKNDPLHRDRWREPYVPEELADLGRLAAEGASEGVDVWFGLSPLGMRVTDPEDIEHLRAKLAAADGYGLRDVCLLVDDMPESFASSEDGAHFPSLAAAHARMVEIVLEVQRALGDGRRLWFVPLHYHGDPADSYVSEIGERIPAEVAIMWTGPEVCSETISAEHGAAVAGSLRRPVLYWDNHPVNDGAMQFDPHLGPLTGREPGLATSADGILANVALQPEASLIAVATVLEFARDPDGYSPEDAWRRALVDVCGDRDADAVAVLAELAPRSPLRRGEPRFAVLDPLVRFDEVWDKAPEQRTDSLTAAMDRLRELLGTALQLEEGLTNDRLRDDLLPWSQKLRLQLDAAILAAELLAAKVAGRPVDTYRRREVLTAIERSRRTFHRVAGDRLEIFARSCLRRSEETDAPVQVAP